MAEILSIGKEAREKESSKHVRIVNVEMQQREIKG